MKKRQKISAFFNMHLQTHRSLVHFSKKYLFFPIFYLSTFCFRSSPSTTVTTDVPPTTEIQETTTANVEGL